MRIGKLTNQDLQRIVLQRLPALSETTITGAAIGSDCACIRSGEGRIYVSSDPVTAGGNRTGTLAIHVSCNDIAAIGQKPIGIMFVLIAPPSATEEELISMIDQAGDTARSLGVDIVGGHTEISDAVNRFVITTTAFAYASKDQPRMSGIAKSGDTLLMTKTAGIEGAYIAASQFSDRLGELTGDELQTARGFFSELSVVREGVAAASCVSQAADDTEHRESAVHMMHDVTEGGVFGAAYEMAELSGCGLRIWAERVPIHAVTRRITDLLGLDPMRLISSGSLLIATAEPDQVIARLHEENVDVTPIGVFTDQGMILAGTDGDERELDAPRVDELYSLYQ